MSSKKIEALWDCTYCGQKAIGGLTKQCPNCGRPQDKDIKFYLPTEQDMNFLDEETSEQYGKGADWICGFCNSLNRYYEETCHNCGAAREDQEGDYFVNKEDTTEVNAPDANSETAKREYERRFYSLISDFPNINIFTDREIEGFSKKYHYLVTGDYQKSKSVLHEKLTEEVRLKRARDNREEVYGFKEEKVETPAKGGFPIFKIAIFAIIAMILFTFWPKSDKVLVDQKDWSRSISVEEYLTVQEADWSVPDGGRVYDSRKEIHHYDTILDHYEDVQVQKSQQVLDGYDTSYEYVNNGDGTYDQVEVQTPRYVTEYYYETESRPIYVDVPVYQIRYYYEIERWKQTRSVDSEGQDGKEPYWGDLNLTDKEREGSRYESYTLTFKNKKGKTYKAELSQNAWDQFKTGDSVDLTIQAGSVKKIDGKTIDEWNRQ